MLWQAYQKKHSRLFFAIVVSYALFGILTVADAVLPLSCVAGAVAVRQLLPAAQRQSPTAWSTCCRRSVLFINVLLVWWHNHGRQARYHTAIDLILAGGIVFGAISFVLIFCRGTGNAAQHYFYTLCSLWLVLLPYIVHARPRAI